jgi:hypothetical protein
MIVTKAYQCEFCRSARVTLTKAVCAAHEKRCPNNPETRSCQTCRHFKRLWAPSPDCPGHVVRGGECEVQAPGLPMATRCASWRRRKGGEVRHG